jgi:glycosyltransferase involved in cell wall biosynthesis
LHAPLPVSLGLIMKLSIIVAVYNEGQFVGDTLRRVWKQDLQGINKEIVIVESNSSDASRSICQDFTREINLQSPGSVKLVLQDTPRGKGHAIRAGLKEATGDLVLIQDADSEYDTNDYPALLAPLVEGRASFVLGSRHMAAGSWQIRKFENSPLKASLLNFGGTLFHALFNIVFGTKLTDPTTMYKVFRRSCIEGVLFEANRFDFDYELTGKLIRLGHVPVEVPVSYTSRGFEEGKKIRILRDPFNWVSAILRHRFSKLHEHPGAMKQVVKAANADVLTNESIPRPKCANFD